VSKETKTRRKERKHFEKTVELLIGIKSRKLRKKDPQAWRALRAGQSYKYPVGDSNSDARW
jgi:hypothetical protein